MNKRYIVLILLAVLLIIGGLIFFSHNNRVQRYAAVKYEIDVLSEPLFTIDEIDSFLAQKCGQIVGEKIDSVSKVNIEKVVESYPYIVNADVLTKGRVLIVKAQQEHPIVKVFNQNNECYYISKTGKVMPEASTDNRLLVASGNINNKYDTTIYVNRQTMWRNDTLRHKDRYTLYMIWELARYIDKHPFWKAQIGQIYLNDKQEIELVPTVGNHVVNFGSIAIDAVPEEVIDNKMNNLKSIYKNGFSIRGWDRYKEINLKYGNEIPCTKR